MRWIGRIGEFVFSMTLFFGVTLDLGPLASGDKFVFGKFVFKVELFFEVTLVFEVTLDLGPFASEFEVDLLQNLSFGS